MEITRPSGVQGKMTPLMQQYWDVKQAHEDKIVLFRMGDFFEMFHRDAEIAAPLLGIALTARNKKSADETPMCGVPHHSIANSINKLLGLGFKVAICDQIEDPKLAKGLVKRAVTRILSPGVVFDPETIDALKANYLAGFDEKSVSFLDVTTGEAFYFLVKDQFKLMRLLQSLQPVEIVLTEKQHSVFKFESDIQPLISTHDHLVTASGAMESWPESALRLLSYVMTMQGEKALETISPFERRELLDRMELGPTVLRHLEVFTTYRGDAKGSLFHAINRCKTSSGARLFRSWLQFPLTNAPAIERRHELLQSWKNSPASLAEVRSAFSALGDIQRRLGKIGNPSVNPRDLISLADSLKAGLEVSDIAIQSLGHFKVEKELLDCASLVAKDIQATLGDEPPIQLKNGGVIRFGVSSELDELVELSTNSHELILKLEAKERELTGISSLKIRFNNVFGYYIEITNTHKDKVPKDRYDRKQTLANAERYLTPELGELEAKVLSAQAKRIELEARLFSDLVARTLRHSQKLLKIASLWAELDVVSSLAQLAIEQNYCRPVFVNDKNLMLKASRHPVIEQMLSTPFVANDINLSKGGCLLLTGPNMAGKSTLMRQVAVSALLAQSGCFVPASHAELPLFDRVFTRIGASDFLAEGLSTFMVEMKETAEMLEFASENSLVVLDEVGRGTSTYDGMSLAQAILEYLLEKKGSMTLFATHYQELTHLAATHANLCNVHMRIHEAEDLKSEKTGKVGEITFLYQLAAGPASKSYGIHVAKLAGLPKSVTRRATSVLENLENSAQMKDAQVESRQMSLMGLIDRVMLEPDTDMKAESITESDDLSKLEKIKLVENEIEKPAFDVAKQISGLDISRLTPLDALNQIAKWQQSLF